MGEEPLRRPADHADVLSVDEPGHCRHLGLSAPLAKVNQFRVLGAAALDLCAWPPGSSTCSSTALRGSLAPWDYLGGVLVCREAGAVVEDALGRDLVVRAHGPRRTPVAAATPTLLAEAVARRVDLEHEREPHR